MGSVGSFLASFSESFQAALVIWPFLSFALTLPILAYLYHRDGRLRFSSALVAYLSVLYMAGLACFTLYPLPSGDSGLGITYGIEPQLNLLGFVADIAKDGLKALFQILFNVLLFLPLGFIAKRFLRRGFLFTVMLSLAVTCLIETAQLTGLFGIYPYAYRIFDVDDILFNTLGGVVGWLCGSLLDRFLPERTLDTPEITNAPGFVRRCVAFGIDMSFLAFFTWGPWILLDLVSEIFFHVPFALPGMDANQSEATMVLCCFAVSFVLIEIILPWCCGGSTFGGRIVRMTFETKQRTGWKRALFYALRALFFLAVFVLPAYLIPFVLIFYLVVRKMPYDLLI